jgi:hypothetical protein
MEEFMGSPILSAVASGVPIATIHSPNAGEHNIVDTLFPWDEEEEEEEP